MRAIDLIGPLCIVAVAIVFAESASAARKPVKKELEALNAQVAALSQQVAAANAALAAISAKLDGLGPGPSPLHDVQLCAEIKLSGEAKLATLAEGEAAGEGSLGVDAYGNGGSVEAKARGKAETGVELKGAIEVPKLAYCFDVLAAAERIRAARRGLPVPRGDARAFDPTQLTPAVQDYVLSVADLDAVDLVNRTGGLAQYVSLEPAALTAAIDALGAAQSDLDPMAILNGDGPLRGLAAALPLPPAMRAAIDDPGVLVDRLVDFRPCELSGLRPNLQGVIDQTCALRPSWDPATVIARFGELGDLIDDVSNVLARSTAIQSVLNAVRTLIGRVCNGVNAIPGIEISCSV